MDRPIVNVTGCTLESFGLPIMVGRSDKPELPVKLYITEGALIVIQGEKVWYKVLSLDDGLSLSPNTFDPDLSLITSHTSVVTCVGVATEGWLICSCSEEKVVLSKLESLLKTFSSYTIGIDFGRIVACSTAIRGDQIITCLAKVNEIVIIESTSEDSPLTQFGLLCLTRIQIVACNERISEPIAWVQSLVLEEVLLVVAVGGGNSVTLKIWEVLDGQFRLKDHRSASQGKGIAGIDLAPTVNEATNEACMVIISPEGHCELFAVTVTGFCLLNRFKLEEFASGVDFCPNDDDAASNIEFRVYTASFFYDTKTQETCSESDTDHESGCHIEELNNSLTNYGQRPLVCPKVLVIVATTKGILVVNLRSGDTVISLRYDELLLANGFSSPTSFVNAKMWNCTKSSVTLALQRDLNSAYTMQVKIQPGVNITNEDFTMCTVKEIESKSVLRKKLKSPPLPVPSLKKRQSHSKTQFSLRSSSVGAFCQGKSFVRPWNSLLPRSTGKPSSTPKPAVTVTPASRQNCFSDTDSPPPSARAVRITVRKTTYNEHGDQFTENGSESCYVKTRLSALSHMRMVFCAGGNQMAVGGNIAPLIVFKTQPLFETLRLLKDARRVMSLQFSFLNEEHLLIATNDGRTEIVNWPQEKQLLSLQFSSKFNEHVYAQFFYMDRFIVQPEDNQIVFYSYRIQDPNSVTAKAGTFKINSQQITAMAAANQFYSSTVLCGGSNKSLIAFDANTEQELVTVPNAHSKPISLIRINEAPKGMGALLLCDMFMTVANTNVDPIKIWDMRTAKCATKIGDVNSQGFVPTSRPGFSPCGRYIASGYEENTIGIYDIRKVNSKVTTIRGMKSSALDCVFDPNFSLLWAGCRDGKVWNFSTT